MRVAIMGAGGIGGLLGARLQSGGNDVHFIARGAHLAAMRSDGLKLTSDHGDVHVPKVVAVDDATAVGPCDVVVFAVKMPDAPSAAAAIKPLVGPDTLVVPYLNGVEATTILAEALGRQSVAGGIAYVSAVIDRPGVVRQTGTIQRFVHGELDGVKSDRMLRWHDALDSVGIESVVTDQIETEIWRKFVVLASFSGMTALTRKAIGPVREHPDVRLMLDRAVAEAVSVAVAHGIDFPDDVLGQLLALINTMPASMKSSMQEDLERGKPLELPWLSGAVVRLGAEKGIEAPIHRSIRDALILYADGSSITS